MEALKFVPAYEVRPAAGLGTVRRVLRAALRRVAVQAALLAASLEQVDVAAQEQPVQLADVRPFAYEGAAGVRFAEAVVCLVVAAYFVAGLVGIFVA